MAVFRVEKTRDYTIMSNHHLKNRLLSLKAKGLLSQMLSLPDTWDYSLKGLSTINRESIDAIREAVRELERAGYIVRMRERNEKGHLKGTEYTIYEYPQEDASVQPDSPVSTRAAPESHFPMREKPTLDFPALDHPVLENPTLLSTYQSITDEFNINEIHYPSNCGQLGTSRTLMDGSIGSARDEILSYRTCIRNNIGYESLLERFSKERLDETVELMVEVLCIRNANITIAGNEYAASLVKDRLLRLNGMHVEYVFDCLSQNTAVVRNIKKYLLTSLFNAPSTIDSYYSALVNHNRHGGTDY